MAGKAGAPAHQRQAGIGNLLIHVSEESPVAKLTLQRDEIGVHLGCFDVLYLDLIVDLILPIEK